MKIDVKVNNYESREILKSILDPSLTFFLQNKNIEYSQIQRYV